MDASRSSSASLCPGCGKEIDPLRAGHVAILEGGFRYFCGAECKSAYIDVSSKRLTLEALTAEPPLVTVTAPSGPRERVEEEPRSVVSGVREHELQEPHFPFVDDDADAEPEGEAEAPADVDAPEEEPEEAAPATLRSTAARDAERAKAEAAARRVEELEPEPTTQTEEEVEAPPPSRAPRTTSVDGARLVAHVAAAAPVVGIALGALAFVVSLAGETGSSLRLPFALSATAILVAHVVLRPREPTDPAPWFVAGPVAVAAAGAVLSLALHDPRAESHAAYAGLAAAGALLVDLLISRARRDVGEARARIAAALAIRVRVVRGESTTEVDAAHVKPGEQVVAEAGEVVGVDGIVAAGEAEVAPWLDSPVVLGKREGDAVVAGATVVSGRLRVTATFAGADRAWLKLGQSHATRIDVAAPLVALARRSVERGVPIAALLVGGATYANNGGWPEVVIAASAGAYALAGFAAVATVALAHARGHIAAQRRGIVYKDAEAFDAAARAEVAVVCSRGTILLGEPEIVAVEAVAGRGAEPGTTTRPEETARVLALAAGAEMASSDASGAAILRAARARGLRPENVRSAIVHAGLGVTALAPNGDKVIVGSRAFLLQEKVSVAIADARVTELEAQGRSVLLVALGDRLVGVMALQDGLRPGARAAVQRLHDARIEPVLLSGEARDTCETIARALDIEHVRPEILPGDRGAEVRALADGGRVVAAVGHPSSDDGALGAADVSVAMTAAGAAPGEWGVALASDDVRDAALALTVPRACRERAKTAALVAAAAQGLSLLGIAFGVAPPALAPIAAVVAAAAALAVVREPTTLPTVR
jgi:P-type Cu+ transporter